MPHPSTRVLLIGDNRNGRAARKKLLEEHGHEVVACSSPGEGLEKLAQSAFNLIVTDYRMDKMDGAEFIRRVRETHPAMPIVLVSGMVDILGLNESNTGANAVVAKNSSEVPNFLHAVERILRPKPLRKTARRQTGRTSLKRVQGA